MSENTNTHLRNACGARLQFLSTNKTVFTEIQDFILHK